jgi:hypothetical protein
LIDMRLMAGADAAPHTQGVLRIELCGDLAEVLRLGDSIRVGARRPTGGTVGNDGVPRLDVPGSHLSLVAGTRNRRSHHSTVTI